MLLKQDSTAVLVCVVFWVELRCMGFYGGWSIKPQLGLSNTSLSRVLVVASVSHEYIEPLPQTWPGQVKNAIEEVGWIPQQADVDNCEETT